MLIAHHLGSTQADALQGMLPRAVQLKSLLGPDPWAVPEGVEVVITQPEDMLPDTYPAWQRRPSHWPGGVRWVHLRSTGVDRYPSWVFDAPMVTTSSGSQATSISEYVLSAILAQEKRGQQLAVSNPKMWIER